MNRVVVENNLRRHVEVDKQYLSDKLLQILQDPDRYLEAPDTIVLQSNFKSKIGALFVDGRKIVIKRHNYKSNWHRFKRFFRKTRARKNWHYAHLLESSNILVPPPVAFVETRMACLRMDSFFLYEHVEGVTGETYFDRFQNDPEKIERVIDYIINLLIRLKTLGLIHGDIRIANLIFDDDKIWLLDYDDMHPLRWYQPARVKQRDIRGLVADVHYNVPESLQEGFIRRINDL
jgi:tRNA A-37 threonylcarbamoyl transferase component Bud32